MNLKDRSILIIYTGGTIGMLKDPAGGSMKPLDFKNIKKQIPEIEEYGYHIEAISFDPPIDSSDISISIWIKLAEIIEENYHSFDVFYNCLSFLFCLAGTRSY